MIKSKPVLIVNTSNLIKGGAIQAAVSFISSLNKKLDEFEYHFILSKEIEKELNLLKALPKNVHVIHDSPSKRKESIKKILSIEKSINPDLVFSFFGPSYVNFKSVEVTGFANGWVTHSTLNTFIETFKGFVNIIKPMCKYVYYGYKVRKSDYWIFETETARNGFIKRLMVDRKRTFVVPNTSMPLSDQKKDSVIINGIPLYFQDINFLTLASNYKHKNIISLLKSAQILKKKFNFTKFKIILTIEPEEYEDNLKILVEKLNIEKNVINLGKVNIKDLDAIYSVTFASVLPSFIETFSAVYPESFTSGTPIVTSDREFAREICGNAAIYFDPSNSDSIATALATLIKSPDKRSELISMGYEKQKHILKPHQKCESYIRILNDIHSQIK
jgi:glycosyltransferase involved in cell wall biosynthesis